MTLVYSTHQNESPTPGWEVQDTTTKHLIKTLIAMKTNTTKSARTTSYYFTTKMNSANGHVIVITTTPVCTFYSFSQSDFWKQMETWRLRAVLCLNALLCT